MTRVAWVNWAAIATWLVVSLPTAAELAAGGLTGDRAIAWGAATLTFGALLVICLWPTRLTRQHRAPLLLVQALCGLVMVWASPNGATGATLVIVAAQLPYAVEARYAWGWVLVQTLCLTAVFWRIAGAIDAVSVGAAFGGFQMFAVATSLLALSERRSREELSRANAELTATRELLAESTRGAERLRISRDLHDTLGHHLTALSIQLDVASRRTSGPAAAHVIEAHAIARLLLSDVREAVSQLRETSRIDLSAALRGLGEQAAGLNVHLEVPDDMQLEDPTQAQALLRSVQEIITNATRHAAAEHLWITVGQTAGGITLDARDDGHGTADITVGNGLKGMRERFEEHSGTIEFVTAAGRGFEIHGFMPAVEPAR
jgi:signal transduction histidine kinase